MADSSKAATPQKRVSRACLFCRARKSRCDLDVSGGQPPCKRCKQENRECVLGSSNRGGSRVRKKTLSTTAAATSHGQLPQLTPLRPVQENGSQNHVQHSPSVQEHVRLDSATTMATEEGDEGEGEEEEEHLDSSRGSLVDDSIPRNPSDAWQLLKEVAKDNSETAQTPLGNMPGNSGYLQNAAAIHDGHAQSAQHSGIMSYRLVREGYITPDVVHYLVARYFEHYHCYLPLVPRAYSQPAMLDRFAAQDKHLLTAVLTISSKDLINEPNLHQAVSRYMHDLISGIVAGNDVEVEAVEALLLLAEWEPQGLRHNIEAVGRGEEDRSAWMHVGMALRTGYFLSLDRTSFRQDSKEEAKVDARKRLAWANCYVSDRLISVRIGRAFWSRGPGPITGLSQNDFPTLQPVQPGDEDHAKIFQATLDLTQLYSNVHDILYSGMRSSGQMMLMGDYVKYVDDFRTAIERWYKTWGSLECSPHIKMTMDMSYAYLKLYTNAFVFQAQISQAIAKKGKSVSLRDHLHNTFSNIGMLPDARFVWGSVAAAKEFLTILATQIDPIKHLRYMPLRFYLYSIYSAVFLYKARSFGVMEDREEKSVQSLIGNVMDVLRRASLSPQDPGSRYARLLELLWMKQPKPSRLTRPTVMSPVARSDSQLSNSGSLKMDAGGYMQYSPANDFSWLDLEAVGDYVSGDPMAVGNPNILAPMMENYQGPSTFIPGNDVMNWQTQQGVVMNNFMYDPNGDLLF